MLLIVLVLLFGALALVGVLSVTRGTPVEMVVGRGSATLPTVEDSLFLRMMEIHTGTKMEEGNHVELQINGEGIYPNLWRDLAAAKRTITVQMYYSMPGAIADSVAAILSERARAGVRILLLLDAFGSSKLKGDWSEALEKAGVTVRWLRPVHWYNLHKAMLRSHVRVVVIDGRVAYTGGFGLADYWQGNGRAEDQWRESSVRFRGPAVAQLQGAFAAAWAEASGELLTGDLFFPPISFAERGEMLAALMHTMPSVGSTHAERFLALSIAGAERTLFITNAYFVPDDDFRALLRRASKRGVDVRVLTTGDKTDIRSTLWAGRRYYETLLEAGIRVYEYQPTMMHAKSLVADGVWSSVGSMNFDNRSLAFNNEANINVLDRGFGAKLDSLFMEDLRYAKEIKLEEFRRRSVVMKFLEWGASLMSRVL